MKLFAVYRQVWQWLLAIALLLIACLLIFSGQRFGKVDAPRSEIFQQFNEPIAQQTAVNQIIEEPIQPIPLSLVLNSDKVNLGKQLFKDVRLSKNNRVSCLNCHKFTMGGADRLTHSVGINEEITPVNSPTVFNARFNFWLNWDGEFQNLTEHIKALLVNPQVMGVEWDTALQKLSQDPQYVRSFGKIYADGLNQNNVVDTIVAYEESLYTPNSRFDQWLRGEKTALTKTEQEGYEIFKSYGCVSCHQGVNVGGNMFQRFGVMGDYFADRGNLTPADLGRFNVTNNEADRYVFRVPSLRNVEMTAPYFHDGSAETLEQAIAIMTKYQLGRPLAAKQTELICQFLRTLTVEYHEQGS
jgi:cytochrome c peroxidase